MTWLLLCASLLARLRRPEWITSRGAKEWPLLISYKKERQMLRRPGNQSALSPARPPAFCCNDSSLSFYPLYICPVDVSFFWPPPPFLSGRWTRPLSPISDCSAYASQTRVKSSFFKNPFQNNIKTFYTFFESSTRIMSKNRRAIKRRVEH